jgi:hypothetical protein
MTNVSRGETDDLGTRPSSDLLGDRVAIAPPRQQHPAAPVEPKHHFTISRPVARSGASGRFPASSRRRADDLAASII